MKKIIQILTIASMLLAWGNQSLAMMSGAQTQQKYQEGIRAIGAGNFNRAQQIVDELNRGKRPQQAQQLSQQLQQAQARVPSAPTTPPPTGLLDSCDQQVDALLRYFGRYPVGQPINRDKRVATKDLLIDTYRLLEAIGIPRQTSGVRLPTSLPVTFGPSGVSMPDFYGFGDVLNMIKQRFDTMSRVTTGATGDLTQAFQQELQPIFRTLDDPKDGTPAEDISDAVDNFMAVAAFFSNAQSLSQINNVLRGSLTGYAGFTPQDPVPNTFREYLDAVVENTEEQFGPLLGFFNATNLKTALFNLNNFQTAINAAFPSVPTAVGTPMLATAQNLGSLHNFIMQFGDINTIQGVLNFLSDPLGNPANDLATAAGNIAGFIQHLTKNGFANLNNLTQLGLLIPRSTFKPTEKNNILLIKQQLTTMNIPTNAPAAHNWFVNLNQQDQQLVFDLFMQNAIILINSNIQ